MKHFDGVRYDGTPSDHVESYFLKATSPAADRALWLNATILASAGGEQARAEGWAIAFDRRDGRSNVAVKHSLSFRDASFAEDELDVAWEIPGRSGERFFLDAEGTSGLISTNRSAIGWELSLRSAGQPFVLLPSEKMYEGRLPSTKTVTPRPDLRVDGTLTVNGASWEIAGWHGMQGHSWGTEHAEQYAFTHCNQWNEPAELVIEAVTARVRMGRFLTPMLSAVCVRHGGRDYNFTGPLSIVGARAQLGLRRYGFSVASRLGKVDAVIDATVENFVGLHYANPSGEMTYSLNAKLAHARVRFEPTGSHPVSLSSNAAALEIGTRRRDHGVRMIL